MDMLLRTRGEYRRVNDRLKIESDTYLLRRYCSYVSRKFHKYDTSETNHLYWIPSVIDDDDPVSLFFHLSMYSGISATE
jgi:hypothetical protein